MTEKLRVVVVDDHPMVRAGVIRTLDRSSDFAVVGEGESCDDAIRLCHDELPDIILLDVSMPGGGIEAARVIASKYPVIKMVMLTVSEDESDVTTALEAGARGYLLKGVSGPELIATLRTIGQGEAHVSPALAARLLARSRQKPESKHDLLSQLTARELAILQHLAKGMSNRQIGDAVGLAERTIKQYMHNIIQKLQVQNRVAAALLAERELSKSN